MDTSMIPAGGGVWAWLQPEAEDSESLLRSKQRTLLHQIKVIKQRLLRAESHASRTNDDGPAADSGSGRAAAAAAAAPEFLSSLHRHHPCEPEHAQHAAAHAPSSQLHMDDDSPIGLPHHARCQSPCNPHAPAPRTVGHLSPPRHALGEQRHQQHLQQHEQQTEPPSPKHASCSPGGLKRKTESTSRHDVRSGGSAEGRPGSLWGMQEGGGKQQGSSARGSGSSQVSGISRKAPRSSSRGASGSGDKVSGSSGKVPGSNSRVSGSSSRVSGTPSGAGLEPLGPATSAADPPHSSSSLPAHLSAHPAMAPAPPSPPPSPPAAQPEPTAQAVPASMDALPHSPPPPDRTPPSHGLHPEAGGSIPSTSSPEHLPQPPPSQPLLPPSAEFIVLPSSSAQAAEPAQAGARLPSQPLLPSGGESGPGPGQKVLPASALLDSCALPATDSCEASGGGQPSEGVVAGTPLRSLGSGGGVGEGAAEALAAGHSVVAGTPLHLVMDPPVEGAGGGDDPGAKAVQHPGVGFPSADAAERQVLGGMIRQLSGDGGAAAGPQAHSQLGGVQAVHGGVHGEVQLGGVQAAHGGVHGEVQQGDVCEESFMQLELVPATPTSPQRSLGGPFQPESCLGPSPEPVMNGFTLGPSPVPPPLLAASLPELHPAAGCWIGAAGDQQQPLGGTRTSTPPLLQQPGLVPALQPRELHHAPPWELHMPGHIRAAWACPPVCPSCKPEPGLGAGARTISCLLLQLPPDTPGSDSSTAVPLPSALPTSTTAPGCSSSSSSSSGSHRLLLLSSGPPGPCDLPPAPLLLADMRLKLDPGVGVLVDQGSMNLQSSMSVHQVCSSSRGVRGGGGCVLITACGVWQLDGSSSSGLKGGAGGRVEGGGGGRGGAAPLKQPVAETRSIFAAARQRRSSGLGLRGPGAAEQAPARGGVDVSAWCPQSGAWGLTQHLEGPLTALCVLLVQLQGRGLVLAAGQGGQAHVWSWEEAEQRAGSGPDPEGCRGCDWAVAQQPTRSFSLPSAMYRGLAVNEVLELRLLSDGSSSHTCSGGVGSSCLLLGCCSEGTVVVWDVLHRQLLSAVHLPICRLSCLQPVPGQVAVAGAASWMQAEGGGGEGEAGRAGTLLAGAAAGHSEAWALQQQQQQQGFQWPLLLLAKVVESGAAHLMGGAAAAGQGRAVCPGAGGGGCCRSSASGQVVLVMLWKDTAQVCPGPDLSRLNPLAHSRGRDDHKPREQQQQQQQQCCPCTPVGDGCGAPPDSVACMAAVGGGWVVIGTASGQVLVWDAATGGLAAALDCSAVGAAVGCVGLSLVQRAEEEEGSGRACGAGGAEQLVVVAGVGEVAVVWRLHLQQGTLD